MKTTIKWAKKLNNIDYIIEYNGMSFFGNVMISVNGLQDKYKPVYIKESGFWVVFYCGTEECMLNISKDKKSARLLLNESNDETNESAKVSFPEFEAANLNRKVSRHASSFFSLIILTLINIPLILFNAPVSFPFSLSSPVIILSVATGFMQESGISILGTIITIIAVGTILLVYLALYYFSHKAISAVWITFGLVILDTLILLGLVVMAQDFLGSAIDLAFHAWILWAILQLGIAKGKLKKAVLARQMFFIEETSEPQVSIETTPMMENAE